MTEAGEMPAKKPPLTKEERKRKIKAIYREMESKKQELGLQAPQIRRGPVFYLVVLMGLAIIGGLVVQSTGKGGKSPLWGFRGMIGSKESLGAGATAVQLSIAFWMVMAP